MRVRHGYLAAALAGLLAVLSLAIASPAVAQRSAGYEPGRTPVKGELPEATRGIDIEERHGAKVPGEVLVTTSSGRTLPLSDLFEPGKPIVFALGYFDCPVACPALMDAMARSCRNVSYRLGEDYLLLFLSFDPTNTPSMAMMHEATMLATYGAKTETERSGLKLLTSSADGSRAIADAMGWQYRYLPEVDEYVHPSGMVVLTPDGRVSRYFYGFDFPERPLRLALLEASAGTISSSLGDKILLFCYHWNSAAGTYSLATFRIMQAASVVTAVLLAGLVGFLKLSERRRRRRADIARGPSRRNRTDTGIQSDVETKRTSGRRAGRRAIAISGPHA